MANAEYLILRFPDAEAWEAWLGEHHASERGVWVQMAKKGSAFTSLSSAEALDVALCYGWIDAMAKSYDADSWLQKYTPRGKRSTWSKRNREHVARLIAAGRMQPAGFAAIDAAKQDGRWERAYDSPRSATMPEDFAEALAGRDEAKAFFESLPGSQRFAMIYRIQTAVKPETRARRVAQFVELLERKERLL